MKPNAEISRDSSYKKIPVCAYNQQSTSLQREPREDIDDRQ
jgi:hypothetical protein